MSHSRPLRGTVDFSDKFGSLPPAAIVGFWLASASIVGLAWTSAWVGSAFAVLALVDWAMLAALPRSKRSFGPPQLPWMSLTVIRLALALVSATLARPWSLLAAGLVQLGVSLSAWYACWVEPAQLGVTQITLRSDRLNGCPPLRLLHISDLHIERTTDRERRLLGLVDELAPDVIVITGDYLNISYTDDETAQGHARELLSQLQAPSGIYAISGSPSVDPPETVAQLLDGLDVIWLRDQVASLVWHGCRLQIAGVECSYDIEADGQKLDRLLDRGFGDGFTLLLYHTPDLMPAASKRGVDLYLAGHTHGGQLRLPFYGALVTASYHGKRYEMGAYQEGHTLLYVSRGVGLEGKGAPRARFLCPPEIELVTLLGAEN
jgi:predicted MPP superfamily phosphohydrolase